jgi:methylthioribose-1-phosphate isomerase
MADGFSPIRWSDGELLLLDQTLLPEQEVWLHCRRPEDVAGAIRRLSVRGAPAIGIAAAYGLVLGAEELDAAYELLLSTRPTAVNLRWALNQGRALRDRVLKGGDGQELRARLLAWARDLHRQDVEANRRIGRFGRELFEEGDRVLTHCNAGALATAGYGTAIGVVEAAWSAGRLASVWVDETRPLLQGSRLTTWELSRLEIPHRLITDSSAGAIIARGWVQKIVVGADRIAANGDVANKVGTYSVAVLAARHGVPFYVAAPLSTIDRGTASGADIPIEERDAEEVVHAFGKRIAPHDTEALNLAFDVTPAELVAALITDAGVLRPPYGESIGAAFSGRGDFGH